MSAKFPWGESKPILSHPSTTKKGVFLYFCPYFNQSWTKNGVLSIIALILIKALPNRAFFLHFCPYSNQIPTKKGVFFLFYLILAKVLPKRVFFSMFALILTKVLPKSVLFSVCLYSNQSPTKKGVFLFFALILTKSLPQRVFYWIILTETLAKSVFFHYFCLIFNKSYQKACNITNRHNRTTVFNILNRDNRTDICNRTTACNITNRHNRTPKETRRDNYMQHNEQKQQDNCM